MWPDMGFCTMKVCVCFKEDCFCAMGHDHPATIRREHFTSQIHGIACCKAAPVIHFLDHCYAPLASLSWQALVWIRLWSRGTDKSYVYAFKKRFKNSESSTYMHGSSKLTLDSPSPCVNLSALCVTGFCCQLSNIWTIWIRCMEVCLWVSFFYLWNSDLNVLRQH